MALASRNLLLVVVLGLVLFVSQTQAFGAGNIASISAIEGKNWRHGDIEDLLKQVSCIKNHKWTTMMIKRTYFGNWLRDYSQAMDVGALKKANGETIRILVWLLSFLGFGYATAEFEVTSDRLGVYRPEEHIDNPKDYNDNEDARKYEPRLRGPIRPIELEVDPDTGMKNYIANARGDWATSAAYVKYSFERSIHYGRQYTQGSGFLSRGNDDDLAEALRLLGQGLHTLEDFGAHTNYVELALIEMGHRDVFPLVGTQTGIRLRGKHVFPLVTGTFGMVDFYHSVLGEATDHFTQSEVNEMDNALGIAQSSAQSSNPLTTLIKLLSKMPGTKDLCAEAEQLQAASHAQARMNADRGFEGGSSRGINDYEGNSRAGPGDYNAAQGGYPSYNDQGSYQQPHQQGYDYSQQQQPSWGQQGNDYSQPQQQSWGQQSHEYTQQTWGQPHDQNYNQPQWGQGQSQQSHPHQSPQYQSYNQTSAPQWNQPQNPQSYTMQQQSQDEYNHPQLQPQQTPAMPTDTGAPSQTSAAQPTGLPGLPNFDPAKTIRQIYPILAFRDKVVRTISSIIEKIPGLEALVDRIVETLTVFILSLLAPFVRPVLEALSKSLQKGSEGVIDSSGQHQYEIWTDPRCSDPTHSVLSKDHFSNVLNEPAGLVAGEILKFIAPRVLYAWEHPEIPVERVKQDIETIFHHPAIRDEHLEVHRNMFNAVRKWKDSRSDHGRGLNDMLSIDSVRAGKNHTAGVNDHVGGGGAMNAQNTGYGGGQHSGGNQGGISGAYHQAESLIGLVGGGQHHSSSNQGSQQGGLGGIFHQVENLVGGQQHHGGGSHQSQQGGFGGVFNQAENLYNTFSGHGSSGHHSSSGHGGSGGGGLNDVLGIASHLPIPGVQNFASSINKYSSFIPGGGRRGLDDTEAGPGGTDISVDPSYAIFGGSNVGGARELYDAMNRANQQRDTSPGPSHAGLQPPSGYEQYTRGGGGHQQDQQEQYGGGYGSGGGSNDYYQGGGGRESSSYYQ